MYRYCVLWLILVGMVLVSTEQVLADEVLPVDDYWQRLQEMQAAMAELMNEAEETQQEILVAWADELAGITAVSLPDESVVALDSQYLVQAMRQVPPDVNRVQNLLDSLLTAAARWPDTRFDDGDKVALEDILAQPDFQYEREESLLDRWLNDLRRRVVAFLLRLLPEGAVVNSAALGNVLSLVALVVLVLVLVYAFRGVFFDFAAEARVDEGYDGEAEMLTATTALKRAQHFSGAGDYRTAVRYLYLSSLLLLEERGLLTYNRSLTNREYLRSVAHRPELAAILRDVIEVFDRVWYGFQTLEEAEYEMYAARVERLRQQRQ